MVNPDYTEVQINNNLRKITARDIRVKWDGDLVDQDAEPTFNVWFNGDDTPFRVVDRGDCLEIHGPIDDRMNGCINWGNGYTDTASKLVEIIEEELAEGRLVEEEEA